MIKKLDMPTFIRQFKIMDNGIIDFFLGSGASVQAGIPTGTGLVWEFKREIYCTENEVLLDTFKDLQSEKTQNKLQKYFDKQNKHPEHFSPEEYSHYFELCYPTSVAREKFIQNKVRDINPTLGHLCLADLFLKNKVKCIWTTNFDELIESGIKTISPKKSFSVFSSSNIKHSRCDSAFNSVIKLHGDYRYDKLKNTTNELQDLEMSLQNKFKESLYNKGIVFIGYSGNDDSIMNVIEKHLEEKDFLKFGLIWMTPSGVKLSNRAKKLMEKACNINEASCIVEIPNFDEILYNVYKNYGTPNKLIEERWLDFPKRNRKLFFNNNKTSFFIKTNSFESIEYPQCMVFDTDIKSWKELKKIISDKNIIAGLFNNKIYCFENEGIIKNTFHNHILSEIYKEKISDKIMYRDNSMYIGLLYELIEYSFLKDFNLLKFWKNKFYDKGTKKIIDNMYAVYDAIEVGLKAYNGKLYLSIIPTIYIKDEKNEIGKFIKQSIINKIMSKRYNKEYNNILKYWHDKFFQKKFEFFSLQYNKFSLKFNKIYVSCGKVNKDKKWPSLNSYQFNEPAMLFDLNKIKHASINQLKGISKFGPIDFSFSKNHLTKYSIKLFIISPKHFIKKVLIHLNSLNQKHAPNNSKDGFLQLYNGFEYIYKRSLQIPTEEDTSSIIDYDTKEVENLSIIEFFNFMKRCIDRASSAFNFDVVIIYIPNVYSKFRESENSYDDFNLHDALKLYAVRKNVKLQFIEEKSIDNSDKCKVLWGLSTSIYAKANGSLWKPQVFNNETAFIGLSYTHSENKGICIGCSQLFDSSGTGIRFLLRKINDPGFYGKRKNPFMKKDEARNMMSDIREHYYKYDSSTKLKRIVIHKTTPFTKDEISGFSQAFEGINDIELLQIQQHTNWRGIKFYNDYTKGPDFFPINRGTVIQLSDDTFLLWTHGSIIHEDLKGKLNYFKGSRGIPAPLEIKRFYGKASGDVIANEIIMLTKMNWNSADNLYKTLPVTIDFSKVLSRMAKQEEAIYDNPYDFRFFM